MVCNVLVGVKMKLRLETRLATFIFDYKNKTKVFHLLTRAGVI
jgi:hypothetical protein